MKLKIDTFYIVVKSLRKDIIDGDTFIIRENKHDPSLGKYIIWLSTKEPNASFGETQQDCKYFNNDLEIDAVFGDVVVEYNLALVNMIIDKKIQEIKKLRNIHGIDDFDISYEKHYKEKRLAYLKGALKHNNWVDYVQNGQDIYDDMEREMKALNTELGYNGTD